MRKLGVRVPGAMQRFFSAASQNRDRTKHQRSLRPRLCSAPLRKGYALRCVRGTLSQQLHRIDGLLLQLIQRALPRRLVRAPAQDGGAVTKTVAAEMIVADLDNQLRLERTP